MSPWSWFLLPTLCLLPPGAAPRRGAPASANCELKPQVRRASGAGEAASPHLAGVVTVPGPRSTAPSDPVRPAAAPGSPFWRGAQPPGRMRPCPQPSLLGRAAEGRVPAGSPGSLQPASRALGDVGRMSLRRPSAAGTWAHLLWKFVLPSLA